MGLPLDTPVGAEIVCIDAWGLRPTFADIPPPPFAEGDLCMLAAWELIDGARLVRLAGLPAPYSGWVFCPSRFRLLQLGGLDALLRAEKPVDA
jgi:hypothetical protein